MNVSKISHRDLATTQTGTPYYASPEVWNNRPYGTKSDIWSLGCVFYEMMAKHPPFRAQNMEQLYNRISGGTFPRIPHNYSEDLQTIVKWMLHQNPKKRPTCSDLLRHPTIIAHTSLFREPDVLQPKNGSQTARSRSSLLRTIRLPLDLKVPTPP
jgi:NIMA (never in mitosis gene a)-related kinase 1/4/5